MVNCFIYGGRFIVQIPATGCFRSLGHKHKMADWRQSIRQQCDQLRIYETFCCQVISCEYPHNNCGPFSPSSTVYSTPSPTESNSDLSPFFVKWILHSPWFTICFCNTVSSRVLPQTKSLVYGSVITDALQFTEWLISNLIHSLSAVMGFEHATLIIK